MTEARVVFAISDAALDLAVPVVGAIAALFVGVLISLILLCLPHEGGR